MLNNTNEISKDITLTTEILDTYCRRLDTKGNYELTIKWLECVSLLHESMVDWYENTDHSFDEWYSRFIKYIHALSNLNEFDYNLGVEYLTATQRLINADYQYFFNSEVKEDNISGLIYSREQLTLLKKLIQEFKEKIK